MISFEDVLRAESDYIESEARVFERPENRRKDPHENEPLHIKWERIGKEFLGEEDEP